MTMALPTVLLISSKQTQTDLYISSLSKRYTVVAAYSGKHGLELAKQHAPQVIILDAASMRTTGERICRTLKKNFPPTSIIHIHPGPRRKAKSCAHTLLFLPLTPRRLNNSVGRLINTEEEISCGPFSMTVSRRILIAHGQETHLNPKQAALVEMFLRNPNRDLDRKTIMETVWKTDYVGDTRTLDVHIRWIRKVMEKRGTKPSYIKTVRGVGYRLEIEDS